MSFQVLAHHEIGVNLGACGGHELPYFWMGGLGVSEILLCPMLFRS